MRISALKMLAYSAMAAATAAGFAACSKKKDEYENYIIRKGDNPNELANRYLLPLDKFKKEVHIPDSFRAGDTLRIPKSIFERQVKDTIYTVKKGDTYYELSNKNGLGVNEFANRAGLNPEKDMLKADITAINLSGIVPVKAKNYTVKKGDTFAGLAAKFNFVKEDGTPDVEAFKEYAGVNKLKKDNEIYVPTIAQKSGMTFWSIASSNGMAQSELEELNPQISDAGAITENMRINVPYKPFDSDYSPVVSDETPQSSTIKFSIAKPKQPLKNGHPAAEEEVRPSTNPKGSLAGKTIIVNAGHHWGNRWDPGATVGDAQEWEYSRILADKLANKLCAQGAKVVFCSGSAKLIEGVKTKYRTNCAAFVSIHTNALELDPNKILKQEQKRNKKYTLADAKKQAAYNATVKRAEILHYAGTGKKPNTKSINFAKNLVNDYPGTCLFKRDNEGQHSRLGVLRTEEHIPSIMLEAGFLSNKDDLANLRSSAHQDKITEYLAKGVAAQFGVKK
ncbi:MAG: LysM peptidoglycan-binding domain-containing protein [Heliobacteriaceae bacterium]|jgi:N-acetylmuramoyl-L-alanine amidase|nr:LysM peptidoglycan-binding domain-containing protein [Heliobacteriaceae bacterium]